MRLLAGVNAPLTMAELQPARNVMRLARRKQLASQQVCLCDAAWRLQLTVHCRVASATRMKTSTSSSSVKLLDVKLLDAVTRFLHEEERT